MLAILFCTVLDGAGFWWWSALETKKEAQNIAITEWAQAYQNEGEMLVEETEPASILSAAQTELSVFTQLTDILEQEVVLHSYQVKVMDGISQDP